MAGKKRQSNHAENNEMTKRNTRSKKEVNSEKKETKNQDKAGKGSSLSKKKGKFLQIETNAPV
jgi:hypothetical protein